MNLWRTDFINPEFNNPDHWLYDIETYPNFFSIALINVADEHHVYFEMSTVRDDRQALLHFLFELITLEAVMVGFNNLSFDYPVLHQLLTQPDTSTFLTLYEKAMVIINTPWDKRFNSVIRYPKIAQIDLLKIHHYDNASKMTSLKTLEINMMMDSVEELPYAPGSILTPNQMVTVAKYNFHDVKATRWFFLKSQNEIELRKDLSDRYSINMTNFSDSKIGASIFTHAFKEAGLPTTSKTPRTHIKLSECILPHVKFEQPEFHRIHQYLNSQTVTETKGVFKNLVANVDGIDYVFGSGGLHGSVNNKAFFANDEYDLILSDVASYYPNLSIKNRFYPEHLSEKFCDIYDDLYQKRKAFEKGTPGNAALKLALNSAYGNSNNQYSNLYDPKFTMCITLNGQLLLAMLVEQLIKISTLEIMFANTDGIMYKVHKSQRLQAMGICSWWETLTGLELEHEDYKKAFIADVNNYILED